MPGASLTMRFLRERLKEAKGIGTPATRAEIIGGLKKQGFLTAQGKHIVPTPAEGHQTSARLQDVDIDLPKISQRTRAQESRG